MLIVIYVIISVILYLFIGFIIGSIIVELDTSGSLCRIDDDDFIVVFGFIWVVYLPCVGLYILACNIGIRISDLIVKIKDKRSHK